MHHGERLEIQVLHRRAHRGRECWRNRALYLKAEPQSAAHYEQIELSALVGSPVVCLVRMHTQLLHDLIDDETLPGCTELGMTLDISLGHEIQKRMQQPGIADVDLG